MKTLLLYLIATTAVYTCTEGKGCGSSSTCCKDDENCCLEGYCHSTYPICCPEFQACCPETSPHCCSDGCCPSGYPVCCKGHCCQSGLFCCSDGCCTSRSGRSLPINSIQAVEDSVTDHGITVATRASKAIFEFAMSPQSASEHLMQHTIVSRQSILSGLCNSYDREKLNEGYCTHVYRDSRGIQTIGVGFNLEKAGARQQIEGVGADYDKVLNGETGLTDTQIETLFNEDMSTAVSCAMSWLPRWSTLGLGPQSAIADMAFNLGCSRLSGFKCLREALSRSPPDFNWAIEEMHDSLWCAQVGERCNRNVDCMK